MRKLTLILVTVATYLGALSASAQFVHPGCLSTQADLDRMKAKVAANAQPWKAGYDRLVQAPYGQLGHTPSPQPILYASGSQPDNYINLARDVAAAYQVALRYHVTGDEAYAAKAVSILMAWANTHTSWNGNTNVSLRAGLYGYQLACAGELVRDYSGWDPGEFATFQNYVRNQFYKIVSPNDVDRGFLFHHHGTCWSHYWANWELAAMATVIATAVLCDDDAIFGEAIDYFHNGVGVGRISELLHYLHPNGLGQSQEFGRDQGHASMLVPLLGTFCEIAWNQGIDLYSELDNAFLAMSENLAKYNLWHDTPYVPYINCEYLVLTNIGGTARGSNRAGLDLVYNHYVNRMGMSAPYTQEAAESIRPEGGGGQYGGNSGGFDQLGFTTLTHSLDPIASGALPSHLRPHVKGGKVTLSWRGSAYAKSYNVKRATTPGGPYINIAKVDKKNTYYMDAGIPQGTTCYYVVSANNPGGESANSVEVSAAHDGQLYGTLIGTTGSAGNWGATRELAMDGSLRNFMDAWAPEGGWVGLDLGAGASAVITGVKYCPRPSQDTTVGAKFQGSNTPDFSDAVDLFTVTATAPAGVFTTQAINNNTAFRYVRFQAPTNKYCTLAEVQFIGNATGMTQLAAPPWGLAVSAPGNGQAALTWSSVSGATDYVIKRATTPGGPYTVVEYNMPWDTDYTDKGLGSGTYYYVVSALNSAGESAHSNEVSISFGLPVARLAFDETSGTVASDSTGNGWNGTLVNGPVWTSGTLNNAVNLDGNDDYVDLPDGILNGAGGCTVATWVYLDTISDWARVFDFGTGETSYMFLAPKAGNSSALRFAITTNSYGNEQQINGSAALPVGAWTHVAVTLNGNTGILYVNGEEVGRNSSMTLTPASLGVTTQNYIGKAQFPDPYLDGRVDDFRVYNQALNPEEVAGLVTPSGGGSSPSSDTTPPAAPTGLAATAGVQHMALDWADNTDPDIARYSVYRSTTSGGPYTAIATGLTFSSFTDTAMAHGTTYYYVVTATDTSLNESGNSAETFGTPSMQVGELKQHLEFDEIAGATAADSGPMGLDATLVNGPAFTSGRLGNALVFAAPSSQYATLPAGLVSELNDFTISTWVKPSSLDNWARIFDFGNGTATNMFLTPQNGANGKTRFAIKISDSAEQQIDGSNALPIGVWTHVAVTLSGSTGTLYIDGVAVGSNGAMTFKPSGMGSTTQNYLGKSQYPDPYFDGALDDFRIYDGALGAGDIGILAAGQLPAPQNVTATAFSGSQINLNWTAVTSATSYNVKRSLTSGSDYTTVASGVTATNYNDTELADGTTYYYVVTASNLGGESASSTEVSATTYTAVQNWRLTHFGTTSGDGNAADDADPDGDGWINEQEYISGTDPNNPSSLLKIDQLQASGNDMLVKFPTVLGRAYRVERSDNMLDGSWTLVQDNIAGSGGIVQVTDLSGAAQTKRFYRIVVRW